MLVTDATQASDFDVEHISATLEAYPAVVEDAQLAGQTGLPGDRISFRV